MISTGLSFPTRGRRRPGGGHRERACEIATTVIVPPRATPIIKKCIADGFLWQTSCVPTNAHEIRMQRPGSGPPYRNGSYVRGYKGRSKARPPGRCSRQGLNRLNQVISVVLLAGLAQWRLASATR